MLKSSNAVHKSRRPVLLFTAVVLVMFSAFTAVRSQDDQKTGSAKAVASPSQSPNKPAVLVAGNLTWQLNIDQAYKLARKSRKLVLVDVYTDWCGWCKKLDRDTYSKPEIIDFLNKQFVCLKIDAEDGAEGQAWSKQHQVEAFPCTAVVDDSGQFKGLFYGYRSAAEFPAEIAAIVNGERAAIATPAQP